MALLEKAAIAAFMIVGGSLVATGDVKRMGYKLGCLY